MDAYTGEIRMFTGRYAPQDWAYCFGQQLQVMQYQALFSIIGNTYGGSFQQGTFNLPNMSGGVVPIHWGSGAGLTPRTLGQTGGTVANTLAFSQMAVHNHLLNATTVNGTSSNPAGNVFANRLSADRDYVNMTQNPNAINTQMNAVSILPAGAPSPAPIPNIQPCLGIIFIICLNGNYPPKP